MPRSKLKNSKLNRNNTNRASKLRNKCGGGGSPDGNRSKLARVKTILRKQNRVRPSKPASRSPSPSRPSSRSPRSARPAKAASPRTPSSSPQPRRSSRWGPRTPSSSPQPRRSSRLGPRNRSPSPPPSRRRSPSRSIRSTRSASNSPSSSPRSARHQELLKKITKSGPVLGTIMNHLNKKDTLSLSATSQRIRGEVKKETTHKGYKFLIKIHKDTKITEVIKKIKQIKLITWEGEYLNNYLQNNRKLIQIQEVYNNEQYLSRDSELINHLIKIFNKTFTLDNYIEYLEKTSMKQFDRVTEDIKRGIAILTLFYGVDDSEMSHIFRKIGKNAEIFKDYISLLNQLFINQESIKFNPSIKYELFYQAPYTSKKFNKDGIDEYVRLRTKEKKDNNQATSELEGNLRFVRKSN